MVTHCLKGVESTSRRLSVCAKFEFPDHSFSQSGRFLCTMSRVTYYTTQIRRIAKKFAESSQKVILNFLKKDEFLTIFASLSSHFFVFKHQIIDLQYQFWLSLKF